jgi:AAA family ATP:ADP antiporter
MRVPIVLAGIPTRMRPFVRRLAGKIVPLRDGETSTAFLMFAYSFLAMTAYNILKPVTRSKFISDLGADNLPWVQLGAGVLIGLLMHAYSVAARRMARRHVIPVTLAAQAGLLVVFWALFQTGAAWVSAAFYVMGFLLGVLLISQFWTLANDLYDARQAKRVFGLIGGGASLGGAMGSGLTAFAVEQVGTNNLLLVSAAVLGVAIVIVTRIIGREPSMEVSLPVDPRGVGTGEALRLLRSSRQLQVIALLIGLAAVGGGILDQQLAMAVASDRGEGSTNAITAFLAQVGLWVSLAGFIIQVGLTSRVHRSLGLAVALFLLPAGLIGMASAVLVTGALWAAAGGRVLDSSLRYTIDKTTREVLFLPVPSHLRTTAKPFIDVTVDRFAKAASGVLMLVLIKPWGLNLGWRELSYATLTIGAIWIGAAMVARREYLRAFRRSLSTRAVAPATMPVGAADLATVETLIEELSSPDDESVLYAIDVLESLDKKHLITPLLLHHPSPQVRARVLVSFESLRRAVGLQWAPAVERLLEDDDSAVRSGAMRALAALKKEDAPALLKHYLDDPVPRVAVTAAVVLAASGSRTDRAAAAATLDRLAEDTRDATADARREVAAGLAHIGHPEFRHLLVSLIHDADVEVAREAIRSARAIGQRNPVFVPALCSLLSHRLLKRDARDALVSYGDDVVPALAHMLRDPDEQTWVRRHIPATLAQLPFQASLDALAGALDDPDGFLRFKVIEAIGTLRRNHPRLRFDTGAIEPLVVRECARYCNYLTLRQNILRHAPAPHQTLLVRALGDKLDRTLDRIYRLLGLIYPWNDIADARFTIEHGRGRSRSNAVEYLDNLLRGAIRARVMPLVDEAPVEDKVRHANLVLRTRPRDLSDTLAQLIHDDDKVVAAAAIHVVAHLGLWEPLAQDVDYVMAQGATQEPAHDAYAFEAAHWALASRHLGERSSEPWLESLPTVELAERLRAVSLFDFVSADELFRIAGAGRQVSHETGREMYQQGDAADAVQFLLDGAVSVAGDDGEIADLQAPTAIGFEEVLEGRPFSHTVRVTARAICLSIDAPEFLTMLSDSSEMAQGLFRMLLAGSDGLSPSPESSAESGAIELRQGPLSPIEQARLLRGHPLFGRATIDELLALVAAASDTPLRTGHLLFEETDRPEVFLILRGAVRLGHEGGPASFLAGPSTTVGVEETLAGRSPGRSGVVVADGQALRIDRDALFAVLSDRIGLLQSLFSGVLNTRRGHPAWPAAPVTPQPSGGAR